MITVEFRHLVAGVPTDATSVTLSDLAGAIGVKRNDTSAVVVADGVAMTRVATGLYRYSFAEPASDLEYTAYFEILYGGVTTRESKVFAATKSAAEMVALIQTTLATDPAGILSISVDGLMVSYTRGQLLDELNYWKRQAADDLGLRPRVANIRLDRGYDQF